MAVEVFTMWLPKRDVGPNSMSGFSFGRGGWGRVTSTALSVMEVKTRRMPLAKGFARQ